AGRPDYHDIGRVVILAEPGASYSRDTKLTEEEVAIQLLKGQMEEVAPVYGIEETSEEFAANTIAARGVERDVATIANAMVGEGDDPLSEMQKHKLVRRTGGMLELSPLGRVMAEHFIGMERLLEIDRLVRLMDDPLEIIAELAALDEEQDKDKRREGKKSAEKKEANWIRDTKGKADAAPAWVAKRKEQNAVAKHEHTKERAERAGKPEGQRKLMRESLQEPPKAPRRATKEQEERIERKKREANQFIPPPKRRSNDWDAIEAGVDARRAGKYDEALKILSGWVDHHPGDSRALLELGKVYDLRGARDEAYGCYQRAAEADTHNREAIDRMNAYLIGITVEIDTEEPASRIPTGVVKKKGT
ncbi:MAG: DEAD/DEAH box helicase, partial [Methanocorpusculum sp.]|nr:DEAD/DEAH box helicase [Methanocorpusculum sp.]